MQPEQSLVTLETIIRELDRAAQLFRNFIYLPRFFLDLVFQVRFNPQLKVKAGTCSLLIPEFCVCSCLLLGLSIHTTHIRILDQRNSGWTRQSKRLQEVPSEKKE